MWYRIQEYDEPELGPIVVGRLKGGALRLALALRVPIQIALLAAETMDGM